MHARELPGRRRPNRGAIAVITAGLIAVGLLASTTIAASAAAGSVGLAARIDGHPVAGSTASHPARLPIASVVAVDVTVRNGTPRPVEIRLVRIQGRAAGLTFFGYETAVRLVVPPGSTRHLAFDLNTLGLKGQATGLLPGSVSVLDGSRHQVASQSVVFDVRGSLASVYGLFGLFLLVLTVLSAVGLAVAIARHQLPENRWRRALRFATPGAGVGLVIAFTLSAVRLTVVPTLGWLLLGICCAGVGFAIGYLIPVPDFDVDEDSDDYAEEQEPAPASAMP